MEATLAEVRLFAGNFPPKNWEFCNGQLLKITDYGQLYSLLNTTYGGDGLHTFGLPNLQGRVLMHTGEDSFGNNYNLGAHGGQETVTLNSNQIPAHKHEIVATTNNATSTTPKGNILAGLTDTDNGFYLPYVDGKMKIKPLNPDAVSHTGGHQSHENMQPYIAMHYIICTKGAYPNWPPGFDYSDDTGLESANED